MLEAWTKTRHTLRAGFARLVGPIFDKELRVAGRRRRSYALRCAYVAVLALYITIVWIPAVELQGSTAVSRAQMEMAAKVITAGIIWFQFLGAQLVAVVLMSTAISDEVYDRTLGVLMTTPLSSVQVVMGKLFSRLLQILLLVATSLPLLAIVRVLGGIPWGYLLVSLCLTLATVVFVGSVSLFFSALCRRAYVVVIVSVLCIAGLFLLVPFVDFLHHGFLLGSSAATSLASWNPYYLLSRCMSYMASPRRSAGVPVDALVSCGILLGFGTVALLAASVRLVGSVALRRAMGEPAAHRLADLGRQIASPGRAMRPRAKRIRRVFGPPMIWKELTCALPRRQRFITGLVIGFEVLLVLMTYSLVAVMPVVGFGETHLLYLWGLLGFGILFTVTASATMISSERERRSWPLLLMTPLTNWEILAGKLAGALRRCGPVWLPLLAYLVALTCARCFHPLAIVQGTIIILSVVLFLSASGFYFGARLRRTTDAVTANLVLAGVLWCVLPIFVAFAEAGLRPHRHWSSAASVAIAADPFCQALGLTATTLDGWGDGIRWFDRDLQAGGMTIVLFLALLAYLLVSLVFMWRAVHAFRRHLV
jgi:ABC-type transport system involved in multi-copper enzyme maturation permease subunit